MFTVYSPVTSNRFLYAVKLVLAQVCGLDYRIVKDKNEIEEGDKVINYSGSRIEGSFQIHPYGLLSEKYYQQFDVSFDYGGPEKLKLFLTEFDHLGYDIFSASFFLVSRMEEYWAFTSDKHGRYTATDSVMHKLGVLHLPLVNIWCKAFLERLGAYFQLELGLTTRFKIINTVDVDNAWAYKNKGLIRSVGGVGKALVKGSVSEAKERIDSVVFGKEDPYDTYSYIEQVSQDKKIESIYFFLLGDRSEFDKNVSHKHRELIQLIAELAKKHQIGIHPSYQSYLNQEQQEKECKRLAEILGKAVTISRKHFLRLNIPETYRIYEKIGLKADYTMGYADHVGFRAGICTPFSFFDLLEDKETSLLVHPFSYMDGTLNQYMNLPVEEAIVKVQQLKEEVKAVEGQFIGVWHNETLNDKGIWKGWRKVFEEGLKAE
ncbi:MAG: polysaccharide deacetylase family protein [Flavobacteriales bacterium]|jgi:hypothetical protein|nr:polysaccharide deacetylase family protein [Flavobacteriales bacterium]